MIGIEVAFSDDSNKRRLAGNKRGPSAFLGSLTHWRGDEDATHGAGPSRGLLLPPLEQDGHLLTVLRYIEQNPVRAQLAARAEDWRWSSAREWGAPVQRPRIDSGPVARPEPWLLWVNESVGKTEMQRIRQSINRGAPFGSEGWMTETAARLGLEASLRPIGRLQKLVEM